MVADLHAALPGEAVASPDNQGNTDESDTPPYITGIVPDIVAEAVALCTFLTDDLPADHRKNLLRRGFLGMGSTFLEMMILLVQDFGGVCPESVTLLADLLPDKDTKKTLPILVSIGNALPQYSLPLLEIATDVFSRIVTCVRTMVDESPSTKYLSLLATALMNLAGAQADLGLRHEPLEAANEALKIRRNLAEECPDVFLPGVAMSLNTLVGRQVRMGMKDEALNTGSEAVDIYRNLDAKNPGAFLSDLAMSLNNFAGTQNALGLMEKALETVTECVEIYRKLNAKKPYAFLPDLATSLGNLAGAQIKLDMSDDALNTANEAVQILRKLAAKRPDVFEVDLAKSLRSRSLALSAMGDHAKACTVDEEALRILTPHFHRYPEALIGLCVIILKEYMDLVEKFDQNPYVGVNRLLIEVAQILEEQQTEEQDQ